VLQSGFIYSGQVPDSKPLHSWLEILFAATGFIDWKFSFHFHIPHEKFNLNRMNVSVIAPIVCDGRTLNQLEADYGKTKGR
jgi:hypothetical protein